MASENLMMAAVQKGADRQTVHELIRRHSQAAAERVKSEGASNDLLDRLKSEAVFKEVDMDGVLNPAQFVGRAPQQVDAFIEQVIAPVRHRYADQLGANPQLQV